MRNRSTDSANAVSSIQGSVVPQAAISKPPGASQMQWDDCREKIFQLYLIENKTLKEVMVIMKEENDLDASPKTYKTKIAQWGFSKNNKRSEILAILRQKEEREASGKESAFILRDRAVDLKDVERYQKRNRIYDSNKRPLIGQREQYPKDLICRTPPPVQRLIPVPQVWRVPEKLLHDIDIYIKGSFESGTWTFNGNEELIESSVAQSAEQKAIQNFRHGLETGCVNFAADKPQLAGLYWRSAFREVESLVKGSYHDIVPNLIQKLNDLNDQGYPELAKLLKNHIARCSGAFEPPGHARHSIFGGLHRVEMVHMRDLEERIMSRFIELFNLNVGSQCYSSFVMVVDSARHKLKRSKWATFDEVLPALSVLDDLFGPSNRRPLEVVRLRADVLFESGMYLDAKNEAYTLIRRADLLEGDEWNRHYFLINGWYIVGSAQYFLCEYELAKSSMLNCLDLEAEFGRVNYSYLFNKEKRLMWERLEMIANRSNQHIEAERWYSKRIQLVEELSAVDPTQRIVEL